MIDLILFEKNSKHIINFVYNSMNLKNESGVYDWRKIEDFAQYNAQKEETWER